MILTHDKWDFGTVYQKKQRHGPRPIRRLGIIRLSSDETRIRAGMFEQFDPTGALWKMKEMDEWYEKAPGSTQRTATVGPTEAKDAS